VYLGFSLLTANREVLASSEVRRIAARYGRTIAQVVFRFALEVSMVPLTSTTDPGHMREDLDAFGFNLDREDVVRMERIGSP
jgi:diketogulonate reductase-like aldo/keto reductase